MEYSDARFMQQSVGPIYGSAHYLYIYSHICTIQKTNSWYANYKMQNRIFQGSAKFMLGKIKKQIWFIYIYI